MTVLNPLSRLGYGALKKETPAETAVYPDTFFEVLSENIVVNWNKQPIGTVAGRIDKVNRHVKGTVDISGTLEVLVEPNTFGYFLQNFIGDASTETLEASYSYEHTFAFSSTNPDTFTYEFQIAGAGYVKRFVGCRITKMSFSQVDNKIKCSIDITAQKAFTNARITVAASSGTTLDIDQTSGITTSDTLIVIDKDDGHTVVENLSGGISSIDSETQITLNSAITQSLEVGDIVVIASQTPSYSLSDEFTWQGGTAYKIGEDIDNTATADIEDFSFDIERAADVFFAANGFDVVDRMANAIKLKGLAAIGSMTKYYDDEEFLDKLREKENFAVRLFSKGATLNTNAQAAASATFGGGNGFTVSATDSGAWDGEIGNDLNVTLAINDTDDLAASIDGANILVELANSTSSKNTGTLIAAAIDALSGVDGAADGTGATEFTTAASKVNLTGGRDANEQAKLQIDMFSANYDPFGLGITEDDITTQEMPFVGQYDSDNSGTIEVKLRNATSSYT